MREGGGRLGGKAGDGKQPRSIPLPEIGVGTFQQGSMLLMLVGKSRATKSILVSPSHYQYTTGCGRFFVFFSLSFFSFSFSSLKSCIVIVSMIMIMKDVVERRHVLSWQSM